MTPQTLAPQPSNNGFKVEIPEAGALQAPLGAERLHITLSNVSVDRGFREVAGRTNAIVAGIKGRRVSLAEIYAAASAIEAAHAEAGYVLARVSVPQQDLHENGDLHIVVTDGFIERIDVSGLPSRVRAAVLARTGFLQGQRHLTLHQIEEPLLIASDIPGLTLRSTLMRGDQPGGTKLVLDGSQHLLSGSVGADNQLDSSLGTYGVNVQLALNSALGLGEQIYGFASGGYDPGQWFKSRAPVQVLGGGIILPLAQGRFTLNPEVTYSRTVPTPAAGAPQTVGKLRRLSLRGNYTLLSTREQQGGVSLTIEQLDEKNAIPAFATFISHDRYAAARLGLSYAQVYGAGTYALAAQVSQGLGNFSAITPAEALASNIPFSRRNTSLNFTKLMVQAHTNMPLGKALNVSLTLKGQTSFGASLLRSEQFALEGPDAVSAYVGGVTAVDEGVTARAELGTDSHFDTDGVRVAPYLLASGGTGSVNAHTTLEPGSVSAAAFGLGARASLVKTGLSVSIEYAHGISDYAPIDKTDRVNISTSVRF